jgi:TAG lipase/steryl ester hydrolase/phospholipase A2/LPA acyltransferase
MSVLGDSPIIHSRRHHDAPPAEPSLTRRSLRRAISIPAVSSLVRDSWSWAGDTLHTYRDGLSREQRQHKTEVEDRKQVLYLKMKHVSVVPGGLSRVCNVTHF